MQNPPHSNSITTQTSATHNTKSNKVCLATFSNLFWHNCRTAALFCVVLDDADTGIQYVGTAQTTRQVCVSHHPANQASRGREGPKQSEEDGTDGVGVGGRVDGNPQDKTMEAC